MLSVLGKLLQYDLREMLSHPEGWSTKYIDYHPPLVERAYQDWGDYRVSLHRIHPCEKSEALFHPHPWPGAFLVFGEYEMGVGYGAGTEQPPVAMTLRLSKNTRYEMVNPHAWHYVRPTGDPVVTVMVTGKPWNPEGPSKVDRVFRELTAEELQKLLRDVREGVRSARFQVSKN